MRLTIKNIPEKGDLSYLKKDSNLVVSDKFNLIKKYNLNRVHLILCPYLDGVILQEELLQNKKIKELHFICSSKNQPIMAILVGLALCYKKNLVVYFGEENFTYWVFNLSSFKFNQNILGLKNFYEYSF